MKTDVLIIGGGPGGAAMAMFLAREGIKPVILEQEEFPRFHIGESLTGEAGQVLRRLGFADEMAKREYPVKHGVKVHIVNYYTGEVGNAELAGMGHGGLLSRESAWRFPPYRQSAARGELPE